MRLDRGKEDGFFFRFGMGEYGNILFRACAQMQQQRCVAAVIEDHVGGRAVRPFKNAVRVFPIIGERFALDGENGHAARSNGGGSVILRRENVARGPADLRAQRSQRLDQHGGLDRHVQRAGDARAAQRLAGRVFFADGHQPRHFGFGDADFLAPPVGQRQVGDGVVGKACHSSSPWNSGRRGAQNEENGGEWLLQVGAIVWRRLPCHPSPVPRYPRRRGLVR